MDILSRLGAVQLSGPLYQQVSNEVRREIVAGALPAGSTLPNEVEFAKRFGISLGTMRKALELLVDQGFIVRRQGQGSYVASGRENIKARKFLNVELNGLADGAQSVLLSAELVPADSEEKRLLAIAAGADVSRVHKVNLARDKAPFSLETSVISSSRVRTGSCDGTNAAVLIEQHDAALAAIEFEVVKIVDSISAICADELAAKALSVDVGVPLLAVARIAYASQDKPVSLCRFSFRADVATYTVNQVIRIASAGG